MGAINGWSVANNCIAVIRCDVGKLKVGDNFNY